MKELIYKDRQGELLILLTDLYGYINNNIIEKINTYCVKYNVSGNSYFISALKEIDSDINIKDPDEILLSISMLSNVGYTGKSTGKIINEYVDCIRTYDNKVYSNKAINMIKRYCDNNESFLQAAKTLKGKFHMSDYISFFGNRLGSAIRMIQLDMEEK